MTAAMKIIKKETNTGRDVETREDASPTTGQPLIEKFIKIKMSHLLAFIVNEG